MAEPMLAARGTYGSSFGSPCRMQPYFPREEFLWDEFETPDGRGSLFDVLESATARGVDVRLIFWPPGDELAPLRNSSPIPPDGNSR
jgi:hypothetical protein